MELADGRDLFPREPTVAVGYHGCHEDVVARLLAGEAFLPSLNGYDWLGVGVYFWEFAPARAREWAARRFGPQGAVLRATLELGHCLNLLDTEHFAGLQRAYELTVARLAALSVLLPQNSGGRHFLDREVVEFYCRDYAAAGGHPFQTVRGCFPEGSPVFDGSKIRRETHVQIVVRDPVGISELELLR